MGISRMRSRSGHPVLIPGMELLRVRAECPEWSRRSERFPDAADVSMPTERGASSERSHSEKHFGKGGNSARMHCMRHVHALPILDIPGWRG